MLVALLLSAVGLDANAQAAPWCDGYHMYNNSTYGYTSGNYIFALEQVRVSVGTQVIYNHAADGFSGASTCGSEWRLSNTPSRAIDFTAGNTYTVEASGSSGSYAYGGSIGVYIDFNNDKDWGTNPCCEIGLRPYQMCNLTELNASNVESQKDLNERARAASLIGTLQAGYTDFHYLRPEWQETCQRDALIGVGQTGIGSGTVLEYDLEEAANEVKKENERVAKLLGINPAARCTTVKPSGTSSCVLGSSSGIHAWHNDYYIRRQRVGKNEALYGYFSEHHPELVEDEYFNPEEQAVIEIPQAAPEGSILRTESPLNLLERVRKYNVEWVGVGHREGQNSHNVSCTISLKEDEWELVGEWMWKNRYTYNGISVLPYNGGTYVQAPFEDISEERYRIMEGALTGIDLTQVKEVEDKTDLSAEAACAGGACEITY